MFGYKSASHSLIAADVDDGRRSFGTELYFDCHRNSSSSTSSGDGISELYCLITSARLISFERITDGTSFISDVAVIDKEENCSAK